MRTLFAISLILVWRLALASHISITGPPPQLHLAVGSLGTTVDTVTFNVPAGSEGTGVSVSGDQTIVIEVAVRRSGGAGGPANVVLSVNSPASLSNGSQNIPMTEISWTSASGIIPPGVFTPPSQSILSFAAPNGNTSVEDTLTFSYANTSIPVAGVYTGTVVYTATAL